MSPSAWSTVLDDLEQTLLVQQAAVLRGAAGEVGAFAPPAGLGPLPASLRARAELLLRSATDLTEVLATAVASTRRELVLLERMRPAEAGSSYVDRCL